ncbi:MAG: RnfABCDGE type electron transport complex subunit A [Lentimicrobiaceae bacterium]|nr:RnfABCDGE type electron transport complex subunit A [Lentimicrobiaceae bacterium]
MEYYILMILGAVLVNNIILAQFLGICPFMGVSGKMSTAVGMGAALLFVMTLSTMVTTLVYNYVLVPLELVYLQTVIFILIIAALVQALEIVLKKVSPSLYNALGIFLPLITTNCAVLGIAITVTLKSFSLIDATLFTMFTALGFCVAIIIFAGIREQLELVNIPKGMKGIPIALITVGILALAFMGFANLA